MFGLQQLKRDEVHGAEDENETVHFAAMGCTYVGWYHSHPRIKPMPSHVVRIFSLHKVFHVLSMLFTIAGSLSCA